MYVNGIVGKGTKKNPCPTPEEYKKIILLIQGRYTVLMKKRTKVDRSILRKYYRNKDGYEIKGKPPAIFLG